MNQVKNKNLRCCKKKLAVSLIGRWAVTSSHMTGMLVYGKEDNNTTRSRLKLRDSRVMVFQ